MSILGKIQPYSSHLLSNKHHDVVDNNDLDESSHLKCKAPEMPKSELRNSLNSPPSPLNAPLNKESNRLATFNNWTITFVDKTILARTGFYHIGPNDLVKCYFCKVEIGMWEPDDNVIDEHLKWSPNCRLMIGCETDNEPIDSEALRQILPQVSYDTCGIRDVRASAVVESSSDVVVAPAIDAYRSLAPGSPQPGGSNLPEHAIPLSSEALGIATTRLEHPEFKIESHRLNSYVDWPRTMKQKPKELAEAGFYYTGKGDRVICFSCGGGLKHWDETDIPWEQHAMWYSKCEYLKLVKGQKYIDEIQARKNGQNESQQNGNTDEEVVAREEGENNLLVERKQACGEDDKEAKPLNDNRLCKICYEAEYNTAFFPCGHIIACAKCASSVTRCPYCRQQFTSVMRVYLS